MELDVDIKEFVKPKAVISCPSQVVRDKDGIEGKYASIPITDLSYTTDGEPIVQRIYSYKFDSNNNGSFLDEQEVMLSSSNNTSALLDNLNHVGKYQIKLEVKKFIPASKTLLQFFDTSTYKSINGQTYIEWNSEKCGDITTQDVEEINTAPVSAFEAILKKNIDIIVLTDYTGNKLNDLNTHLTQFKTTLNASNTDVNYTVLSNQKYIGTQTATVNEYAAGVRMYYYKTGDSTTSPPYTVSTYNNKYETVSTDYKYAYEPLPPLPNFSMYTTYYNQTYNGMFGGSHHEGTRYVYYDTATPNDKTSIDLDTYYDYSYVSMSGGICGIGHNSYSNIGWYPTGWHTTGNTTQKTYNVYSSDTGQLKSITPRQNSNTYILLLCDSVATTFSTWGQYFPFGNIDNETLKYAASKNAGVIAIMPQSGVDILLNNTYNSTCTAQTLTVRQLVNASDGGKLFDVGKLQDALEYIKSQNVPTQLGNSSYVLVNEDTINYSMHYSDYENDPKKGEQWKYTHSPKQYENDLGLAAFSGQTLTLPVQTFDKTGKYDVEYTVQDDPTGQSGFSNYNLWSNGAKTQIFAHRRPVAQFSVGLSKNGGNYTTTLSNMSYDLDHMSRTDRGIVQAEWQYKESCVATWTDGMLPDSLPANKEYDVKLEVQDLEGAWSMPNVQTVKTYGINLPPNVDATPQSSTSYTNITATVTASDNGENDYSYTKYAWTTSINKPSTGWQTSYSKSFTTTLSTEGTCYLHLEAFDSSGNSFYRVRGAYTILHPEFDLDVDVTLDHKGAPDSIKSGYGFGVNVDSNVEATPQGSYPVTGATKVTVTFHGKTYNMELKSTSGGNAKFVLPRNPKSVINARKIYIPVETPDGTYDITIHVEGASTPYGTLDATVHKAITVKGNMYEDDYITPIGE